MFLQVSTFVLIINFHRYPTSRSVIYIMNKRRGSESVAVMQEDEAGEFVQLLTAHQSRLYAYVLSLVGNPTLADDVLQETNTVLWEKASEFTPGTNFVAWMMRIAFLQVMAQRQRRNREKIMFDSDMISEMAVQAAKHLETNDSRQRALQACLEKLGPRHQDLVRRRYSAGAALDTIASDVGQSTEAVKQALFRARTTLIECVKRTLALENA